VDENDLRIRRIHAAASLPVAKSSENPDHSTRRANSVIVAGFESYA
jgi:hypothetical protein